MVILNEEQVRQIVMTEWLALLGEAGERRIVRPGGASTAPATPARPDIKPAQFTRKVTGLGDIVATNRNLTPDSPFVAGSPAFNAMYNSGNAEELIRFKLKNKGNPDDDRMMSRLVSHVFNAGTFCIVPELFNAGELGVGEIIDIVNRPVPGAPGQHAPLALIDFSGRRVINVGIAFLEKISRNKTDEYTAKFKMNQREAAAKAARPSMGGMRTVKYGAPR